MPKEAHVELEYRSVNAERVGKARELADRGASVNEIATALGVPWFAARNALDYDGPAVSTPHAASPERTQPTDGKQPNYVRLAPEVARLRDQEKLPFGKIGAEVGIGAETARRAYDYHHRVRILEEIEAGTKPTRGRHVRLPQSDHTRIRKLIRQGQTDAQIAQSVGCGLNTVRRARKALEAGIDE